MTCTNKPREIWFLRGVTENEEGSRPVYELYPQSEAGEFTPFAKGTKVIVHDEENPEWSWTYEIVHIFDEEDSKFIERIWDICDIAGADQRTLSENTLFSDLERFALGYINAHA